MQSPSLNDKIIFGLKLKTLRKEKGLLLSDLAQLSGISISYLNEIEKSKKYPRQQKIHEISKALGVSEEFFISKELSSKFSPVVDLLESNFLQELPLDVFGIDPVKIIEMVAEAPSKVGAFISTLVEMSRLHGQQAEHFYIGAMRAYQEIFNNYFEELELSALQYIKNLNKAVTTHSLENFLLATYQIKVVDNGLAEFSSLKGFRSLFKEKTNELLLQSGLNDSQKKYLLLKESAYHFLGLSERSFTDKLWKINNFEQVLNNFKAHYFASCVLIPREDFISDLRRFISLQSFDPEMIESWVVKYDVSPELLMHRFNLLPQYLGLDKIFFLRVVHQVSEKSFEIDKELHLTRRHDPQANRLKEHYCRRWLSVSIFEKLKKSNKKLVSDIQRSVYQDSGNEYICLSIAKYVDGNPDKMISITTGLFLDENSASKLNFIKDTSIQSVSVNITCERCGIKDCKERVSDPTILMEKAERKLVSKALEDILNT